MKKNISLSGLLICLLVLMSCKVPPPVAGTTGPKIVSVQLQPGFLTFWSRSSNDPVTTKVTISVDRYSGNQQFQSNYKTYIKYKPNIDDMNTYYFNDIEVPLSGSYLISVTVDTDNCMKYASGPSCNWAKGRVIFRGQSLMMNDQSTTGTFWINPVKASEY